jgi:large subunit ribosomal protein L13
MVIIINAEKVRVTGRKLEQKFYQRFSGYPSGQKSVVLADMLQKRPTQVIRLAILRMMPKSKLGSQIFKKVKIYAGEKHDHSAQKPILLEV